MRGDPLAKRFDGFPARGKFTAMHNSFFSSLLPQIDDLEELKATLFACWMLYQKKGYPRYVTLSEMLAEPCLATAFSGSEGHREAITSAMEKAVRRGSLLQVELRAHGDAATAYLLNTDSDRRALDRLGNSQPAPQTGADEAVPPERRDIFTLYEANVGMLTPLIAEDLKEAEKLYPQAWIADAFHQAVMANKRNWRYISRILQRWATEGKDNGKPGRYSKQADPDKYIRGKYGHIVKR